MNLAGWTDLPVAARVAVAAMVTVQIGVEVAALVVLVRTPVERVRFGKKWPWLLAILFVNLVGAIVFLAAGRLPAPADVELHESASHENMARAAEILYGSGKVADDD